MHTLAADDKAEGGGVCIVADGYGHVESINTWKLRTKYRNILCEWKWKHREQCRKSNELEMRSIAYRSCQAMDRFPSWLLWWVCVSTWIDVGTSSLKVKFGVILPVHPVAQTMHPCTTLPIAMAEEWLIAEDLTPLNWVVDSLASSKSSARGWRNSTAAVSLQFDYRDSQYSDTFGPVRAMEIYYLGAGCQPDDDSDLKSRSVESPEIQVFYGPCDKYVLYPITKYAEVWNVPVITPGGLTSRFNNETEYVMLTRFIAPFHKVAEFVMSLLAKYGWWHLSFLFHNNIGPDKWKGYPMCYDIKEAVAALIDERGKSKPKTANDGAWLNGIGDEYEDKCCVLHQELFNENYYDYDVIDALLDKIRKASRGKLNEVIACVLKVNPTDTNRADCKYGAENDRPDCMGRKCATLCVSTECIECNMLSRLNRIALANPIDLGLIVNRQTAVDLSVLETKTRKPCCRKGTARCRSCCFWFKFADNFHYKL